MSLIVSVCPDAKLSVLICWPISEFVEMSSLRDHTQLLCKKFVYSPHRISFLQCVAIQAIRCAVGHLAADHCSSKARRFRFKKLLRFGDCAFDLIIRRLENLDGHRGLIGNASPLARESKVSREQRVASKLIHRRAALV